MTDCYDESLGPLVRTRGQASPEFVRKLQGYGLTTAEITYRKPGATWLINPNTFVLQQYDLCPRFPKLFEFLTYWQKEFSHAPLFSVKVAHSTLVKPAEFRSVDGEFKLH